MTAPAITLVELLRNTTNDVGTATAFDVTSEFLGSVTPTNDGTTVTYAGASVGRTGLTPGTAYYYWLSVTDQAGLNTVQYLGTITTASAYSPLITAAVDFDGVRLDLTVSSATPTEGTISFWFKRDTNEPMGFFSTDSDLTWAGMALGASVLMNQTNGIRYLGFRVGAGYIWTSDNYENDFGWHHVIWSWNSSVGRIYIDDAVVPMTGSVPFGSYTKNRMKVGPMVSAYDLNCCLAEVYYGSEYIDLSVEANRRKFISATGAPVSLGADGSLPTGNQPDVYVSGQAANWNAGKNFGSASDFTVTGALTDCASTPGISSQVIPAWVDLNTTNVGSITGGFGNLNVHSGERRYDDAVFDEVDVTIQATLPDNYYVSRLEPLVTHTTASSFSQLVEFKFYNSSNQLVYSSSASLNSSGGGTLVGSVYNVNKVVKRMTVRSRRLYVVIFQKMLLYGFQQ